MWSPVCDVFKEESEENSMTKNLISLIAKELGVEIGEEFKIQGYLGSKYRWKEDKLEVNFGGEWLRSGLTINDLVNSKAIKLPFEPKYGEEYWTYMGNNGTDDWGFYQEIWNDSVFDYIYKSAGCVFRTKEEARAALPVKYKELTGKEWEKMK